MVQDAPHFVSYSWLVRGRLGLEPLLRAEMQRTRPPSLKADLQADLRNRTDESGGFGRLEVPENVEAEGVVEITGPWDVLYWALGCRLCQSIWLRVGEPFNCESIEALEEALSLAPWDHFLDALQLHQLRVIAWERESRLDAEDLRAHLQAYLRGRAARALHHLHLPPDAEAEAAEAADAAEATRPGLLRAVLHRNRCSLELLCAARLGLRDVQRAMRVRLPWKKPTHPAHPIHFAASARPPTWTLASAMPQATQASKAQPFEESELKAETREAKRTVDGTFVAALIAGLRLSDGMVVWDPFCRDGQVLLELLLATLPVPPVKSADRLPCAQLRPHRIHRIQSPHRKPTQPVPGFGAGLAGLELTFVGSDRSIEAIQEARRQLLHFCEFYKDFLSGPSAVTTRQTHQRDEINESDESKPRVPELLQGPTILEDLEGKTGKTGKLGQGPETASKGSKRPKGPKKQKFEKAAKPPVMSGTLGTGTPAAPVATAVPSVPGKAEAAEAAEAAEVVTYSSSEHGLSLPCEVSLNLASFEAIAPYLHGAVIVTRMPSEGRGLGPTARVALLYRRFGHFLAGRRDLLGAYVLCDSPVFRRQTGLTWQVLGRFRGASGRRWQLLHWSPGLPQRPRHPAAAVDSADSADLEPKRRRQRWERAPRGRKTRKPRFRGREHTT